MDIKTISVALAIVTVSAVIFGALLPMFQDVTATEDTLTNDGYFRMTKYSTDTEFSASWSSTTNILTIGDKEYSLSNLDPGQFGKSIMASDMWCLRLNYNDPSRNTALQFFSGSTSVAGGGTNGDLTITASGGTITVVNSNSNSRTDTYNSFYCISDDGQYVMKKADKPAYVKEDSFFMGVGLSGGTSTFDVVGLSVSGSMANGGTIEVWRGPNVTFSDVEFVGSQNKDYVGVFNLDQLTFTATDSENDTLDIVYSYFIVPYEVTAERSVHVDGPTGAIIDLIPLIVALSIVILAVGWFITRKL